jgi:hypothetical protein
MFFKISQVAVSSFMMDGFYDDSSDDFGRRRGQVLPMMICDWVYDIRTAPA